MSVGIIGSQLEYLVYIFVMRRLIEKAQKVDGIEFCRFLKSFRQCLQRGVVGNFERIRYSGQVYQTD